MTIREALQQEWDAFMVEKNAQGKRTQAENWRHSNPGEWQKLSAYRAGGARPSLSTSFGIQMVEHVDAWLMTEASPPPDEHKNPVGAIRYAGTFGSLPGNDRYRYYIVSGSDAVAAKNAPGVAMPYVLATGVESAYWTGVDYSTASANNWLLKKTDGSFLMVTGNSGRYIGDIGDQDFRDEYFKQVMARPGYEEGVFFDNTMGTLIDMTSNVYPAKYPTQPLWAAAQRDFILDVGGRLKAAGRYVCLNAISRFQGVNDASTTKTWWTQVAPGASMLCAETWMTNPADHQRRWAATNDWRAFWTEHLGLVNTAQNAGADFACVNEEPFSTQTMRYIRASMLLEWDGGGGAMFWATGSYNSTTDPWNLAWTIDMGAPTGAKTAVGSGCWGRSYENGRVIVNPTLTPQTVAGVSLAATDAYLGS